jgi:hypothetical protein
VSRIEAGKFETFRKISQVTNDDDVKPLEFEDVTPNNLESSQTKHEVIPIKNELKVIEP